MPVILAGKKLGYRLKMRFTSLVVGRSRRAGSYGCGWKYWRQMVDLFRGSTHVASLLDLEKHVVFFIRCFEAASGCKQLTSKMLRRGRREGSWLVVLGWKRARAAESWACCPWQSSHLQVCGQRGATRALPSHARRRTSALQRADQKEAPRVAPSCAWSARLTGARPHSVPFLW